MPSVTLHLVLADRVLERWLDAPHKAPFDPHDSTFVNAFHQGAFGPDLGYFPGGTRLLSELSHLVRSGDLARHLVSGARTQVQRAFAWGWVTHLLGDQSIHPLVGRAVGEFVYGDRAIFADGARHQAAHVQVETGLDAFYSRLFPEIRKRKMAPVFDGDSIRFLIDAYGKIYRLRLDPSVFMASHLATARMSVQGLMTIGALSTALLAHPISPTSAGARWVLQGALTIMKLGLRRDSLLKAFLNPTPPTDWLVEKVGRRVDGFARRFFFHYRTGLRHLRNFNLDTGAPEESTPTHLGTVLALKALEREGGGIPENLDRPTSLAAHADKPRNGAYD